MKSTTVRDAELERDAQALFAAVRRLLRIYQFRDRQRTCYHDISVTQCYALEALARHGSMTVNLLSAELMLEKSSASRMIDSLKSKGYVRRKPDPRDGRARIIEMTGKGRRIHDRIVEELVGEKLELLAGITKSGRAAAIRVIGELARAAENRFEHPDALCGEQHPGVANLS